MTAADRQEAPGGFIRIGGIVPHPPIMVPEVGGTEARKVRRTQEALVALGRRIAASGAETMVVISPHGPVLWDAISVVTVSRLAGNLSRFGAPEVSFSLTTDGPLADALRQELAALGLPETAIDAGYGYHLDHGITAPLYWLQKGGIALPVVVCGMAIIPLWKLYGFGVAVQRAAVRLGRRVAVVASGDLSHRLLPEAPNGYDPMGAVFDRRVQEIIAAGDPVALIRLDPLLVERAGECGLRPMVMLFGAFDGLAVAAEVLSYEGPFGVGYMVACITPRGRDDRRRFWEELNAAAAKRLRTESFLVRVAREAIKAYIERGERLQAKEVPPEFDRPAGVFVSLKKDGVLRGCIGTVEATQRNIVEEVIENAISAATRDPRFDPVSTAEVDDLTISVDILGAPEPVEGLADLDPKRYGVIVSSGRRRGLLLPDIQGVDTPEEQVAIARRKAGIGPHEPVKLERFEVVRYH